MPRSCHIHHPRQHWSFLFVIFSRNGGCRAAEWGLLSTKETDSHHQSRRCSSSQKWASLARLRGQSLLQESLKGSVMRYALRWEEPLWESGPSPSGAFNGALWAHMSAPRPRAQHGATNVSWSTSKVKYLTLRRRLQLLHNGDLVIHPCRVSDKSILAIASLGRANCWLGYRGKPGC